MHCFGPKVVLSGRSKTVLPLVVMEQVMRQEQLQPNH
jgi:hypothetical protein